MASIVEEPGTANTADAQGAATGARGADRPPAPGAHDGGRISHARALSTEELALLRRTFYVLRANDDEIRLVLTPTRYFHNVPYAVFKDAVTGAGGYLDLYAVLVALWASEDRTGPALVALLLTVALTAVGSFLRHRSGYVSFGRGEGRMAVHLREKISGTLPFPAFVFQDGTDFRVGSYGALQRRCKADAVKACYDALAAFSGGADEELNRLWGERGRALARNFTMVNADGEGVTFLAADKWWHEPYNGLYFWFSPVPWLPYLWSFSLADDQLWGLLSGLGRCLVALSAVLAFRLWTVASGPFFWCRLGREWRLAKIKRDGTAELANGRGRFQVRWEVGPSTFWRELHWDSDEGYIEKWSNISCNAPGEGGTVFAGSWPQDIEAAKQDLHSIIDRTAGPYRGLEPHETTPSDI